MAETDHSFMKRAVELAKKGLGNTAPNPMVGAVLVYQNRIIGEGYHHKRGEAHAEVNCINSVEPDDSHLIKGATLYVTLEPCSHYGKTPPCASLIIEKKIPKVVVASLDPNPKVAGKGIALLRNAGVEVVMGVERKAGSELNKRFFTYFNKKRPYIILKWAASQDGFMALPGPRPVKISNEITDRLVHKWRSEEQAILIGSHTATVDNPLLTNRLWTGKSPIRIILSTTGHLNPQLRLLKDGGKALIYNNQTINISGETEWIQIDPGADFLEAVMKDLFKRQIISVLIEGGARTLQSFINQKLWDEARMIRGDIFLKEGLQAPVLPLEPLTAFPVLGDHIHIYKNPS